MASIDPGQRLGRYEILQLVGQGGLSSIYLARDPALRRNVALKLSSLDTDGELEPRMLLQSEGEILAQLQHPSILKVFDQGEENGRTFLILEYMEGGTFQQWLREQGAARSRLRVVEIVAEIADALDYVHRRGFLHRNVKPA
jgi:serine/threonine protein kinase